MHIVLLSLHMPKQAQKNKAKSRKPCPIFDQSDEALYNDWPKFKMLFTPPGNLDDLYHMVENIQKKWTVSSVNQAILAPNQGFPNYGPQATSGPLQHFIWLTDMGKIAYPQCAQITEIAD